MTKDPQHYLRYDRGCRVCGHSQTTQVLKLQDTPLEDEFLRQPKPQPTFPLMTALCEKCGYYHLPFLVSPKISYADYLYRSQVSPGLRDHYFNYASEVIQTYAIPPHSLVVDLGSNDGSMLAAFQNEGMRVVGVEPAKDAAKQANDSGLKTICGFFTRSIAEKILRQHGPASVVTANYMYANIDDLKSFTRCVAKLLDRNGLFVVQTGYHPDQMKKMMFDYVYHEHFSYFTVTVLRHLFYSCGLELLAASKQGPKGGSIRVVAQRMGGNRALHPSVEEMIRGERKAGMEKPSTYKTFAKKIQGLKIQNQKLLKALRSKGEVIYGFGASHSTTTLIYHFGLAPFLKRIVDDNPAKHGTFSPGHHIRVGSSKSLNTETGGVVLVLAWQHRQEIVRRHQALRKKGFRFFAPLPKPEFLR